MHICPVKHWVLKLLVLARLIKSVNFMAIRQSSAELGIHKVCQICQTYQNKLQADQNKLTSDLAKLRDDENNYAAHINALAFGPIS
jgi:hypothetical protein